MLLRITGIVLGMLLTASQPSAHHSDTDFDPYQLITLKGVVTTFRWVNPHIWVYLDVKDVATGKMAMWSVEGAPPGRIGGTGLRDALKPGDQITVTAYRAKNRSRNYARGYELTLSDGRRFIIGPEAEEGAEVKKHIDAAKQMAGAEWSRAQTFLCSTEQQVTAARLLPSQVGRDYQAQRAEPMKIFDNLYFLGQKTQASWALTTSQGIMLIHAGYADQVEPNLIAGMKKLGLDPAQVKYVFMPHRQEEYSAARYFKDRFGSRIVLSAADWSEVEKDPRLSPEEEKAGFPVKPTRDVVAADGQVFTLGDQQVTTVMIPGLTPGSVGFIFPVKDGGARHMVALFGGTILNPAARIPLATFQQYLQSIDHFRMMTAKMNVDVEIAHHPIIDDAFAKMDRLRARKPGVPHPFVVGPTTYGRYLNVLSECMRAQIARRRPPSPPRVS